MSKTDTTTTIEAPTVDWSAIIGAIDEVGGTLGRIAEGALSASIVAMTEGAERVRPIIVNARTAWKADKRDRNVNDYTADMALATATATDPKAWARFGRDSAGKRTATNLAAVRFINFTLHHSAENEGKYKSIYESYDFDSYCDFLPNAWQYTAAGNLIKAVEREQLKSEAKSKARAEVSAETRMFTTDVNTLPEVKNAASVADKLVELRALVHDAQEQYNKLLATASQADKSAASKAYRAKFDTKTAVKIAAKVKAAGYAD